MAPCIRKKLALTSPTSGGRSVGIVRSRTLATELLSCCVDSWFILFYFCEELIASLQTFILHICRI
jgi:hypothetical protein